MNKYDDIIDIMPRPRSERPKMSLYNRAAQFSPFAALVGFDSLIGESGRLTDHRIELDEYEKEEIRRVLDFLDLNITDKREVEILYFKQDPLKEGGAYINKKGIVKKIDNVEGLLIFEDKEKILIDDLISAEIIE